MSVPELDNDGFLPMGIHAASLREVLGRYAVGSPVRAERGELLRQIVEAAKAYPTIKRVLVWGSFVTAKAEPRDLDYSIVVAAAHNTVEIAAEHQWFFVPALARQFYGADVNYVRIYDYPLETYAERMDFVCRRRGLFPVGIIEISVRGESLAEPSGESE